MRLDYILIVLHFHYLNFPFSLETLLYIMHFAFSTHIEFYMKVLDFHQQKLLGYIGKI